MLQRRKTCSVMVEPGGGLEYRHAPPPVRRKRAFIETSGPEDADAPAGP